MFTSCSTVPVRVRKVTWSYSNEKRMKKSMKPSTCLRVLKVCLQNCKVNFYLKHNWLKGSLVRLRPKVTLQLIVPLVIRILIRIKCETYFPNWMKIGNHLTDWNFRYFKIFPQMALAILFEHSLVQKSSTLTGKSPTIGSIVLLWQCFNRFLLKR